VTTESTPFPTLDLDLLDQWSWPAPPVDWPHVPPPAKGTPQRCEIEAPSGATVPGEMFDFDPKSARVTFQPATAVKPGLLAFSGFRRLTVVEPLRATPRTPGAALERVSAAGHERGYTLPSSAAAALQPMSGRTAGHVETDAGLFLFTPVDEWTGLQRVFVPRSAYSHAAFGPTAEEIAARQWIASPQALLEAIEHQNKMPVRPLGQSLLALGLLTPAQLESALARPQGDVRLGEALVAAGLISDTDRQAAVAHKMGYPMVDLTRFPVDPAAVAKVPKEIAARLRMLPLMTDKGRLIVAVDKPSRVVELRSLHLTVPGGIVPVLAPRMQIAAALDRLSRDVWLQHVGGSSLLFQPTD
jgi:hypothetical protein